MQSSDYLRALLMPASVALVGASSKPGSIGRIVLENMLGGAFRGALYAVNPNHRRVLAQRSYASLAAIGKPVELALIVVPAAAVLEVLEDVARAGIKVAVILSAPPSDPDDARRWQAKLLAVAAARGIRLLGPHSFGVIRTDIGLNATLGNAVAHPGRLALVAQSGAVCAAMLDFAASGGIGFSTVVALGGAMDVGFGELLDALLFDPQTEGILLYAETVGDPRRFLSALRAAARTKPVVLLKAGRSLEHGVADAPSPDAVFDAAMRRAGTVRVKTYAQLFAAARILAMHRISRGDRLAIVTNGHGPGTLAADSAGDRGIALADFSPATEKALSELLPPNIVCGNPINVRGDATPARMASAVAAALADAQIDAVLVLHVPRPVAGATDMARAVAAVARRATKPVLGAWLGAVDRREATAALEAGGIANFYTPEHAVEAFSFLAAYRHHQEWLLEVPPSQPEPQPLDLAAVERIRADAASTNRRALTEMEVHALLSVFGLPVAPAESADTLAEALAAARRLGFPVTLRSDTRRIRVQSAGAGCARTPARRQDADPCLGHDDRRSRQPASTPACHRGEGAHVRRQRECRDRDLHRRGIRVGDHLRPGVRRRYRRRRRAAAAAESAPGAGRDSRRGHVDGICRAPMRPARQRKRWRASSCRCRRSLARCPGCARSRSIPCALTRAVPRSPARA